MDKARTKRERRLNVNNSNLIPNTERSPSELREMGRKGGIASGKARRRKRDLRKMMQMVVDLSFNKKKVKPENQNQTHNVRSEAVEPKNRQV